MPKDNDASLGDQNTFQGKNKPKGDDFDTRSLGDQATFAGGKTPQRDVSLGDQMTFGAGGDDGGYEDDGMEIIDLEARYKIEKVLGKGGMGEVLLATDTRLNRKVAIKRILGEAARSRTAVSRFLTEAQSIAALNHPNIVQIYDYGRAKDGPFLIMEFVEGNSLLDRCREGALPVEEAVDLTCQLCDGLGKAHDAGIIHRDIKPANVLMTPDGTPKLTDFGLAKAESADTGMTMAGAVLGTLDFMPPEQRRDAALTDNRSDLWSLAATLYQMVTGKSPKIIKFNDVPKGLQDVLGKALEDQKEDRFQSAKEFKQALKASLSSGTEVELELGACPKCSTKNESNRKFCKKCAQSLEVPCLSCSAKIPMWEEVCGHCGTQQSSLLEQRKQAMAGQREQAEQLLEKFEFENATRIAQEIGKVSDLRLQQLKGWSDKFLQQVESAKSEQLARITALVSEAQKHDQAYDYPAALHTLEQVPEVLRRQTLSSLKGITASQMIQGIQKKRDESQRLEKTIRQRVASKQVNGLLEKIDLLLKLRPDHAEMLKLKQQLTEREAKLIATRDEAYAAAKECMAAQNYEGVLKEIARIDPYFILPEITSLKDKASSKAERVRELQKTISKALEQKQYHGLLAQVNQLLELKPSDAAMKSLQTQLIARDEKNAAQIKDLVKRAHTLINSCMFEQANKDLMRIPSELQTQEVIDLIQTCEEMLFLRQAAMIALANSQNYATAISGASDYRVRISGQGWTDTEFQSEFSKCQQGLDAQQEAEAAAERNRKLMKQLSMAGATVLLIAILVWTGLWARSTIRAYLLANAVKAERWLDVLAIDPHNARALLGRASYQLNRRNLNLTISDVNGAVAELKRAEEIDPNLQGLNAAKLSAYTIRAELSAKSGKVDEAESDLAEAIKIGENEELIQSEELIKSARKVLAEAYVKQAETTLSTGKTTEASASIAKAQQLDRAVPIPNEVVTVIAEDAVKTFEQTENDQSLAVARLSIEALQANIASTARSSSDATNDQSPLLPNLKNRIEDASALGSKTDKEKGDLISGFKQRLATRLLARGRKAISRDPDRAVLDLGLAEEFGLTSKDLLSSLFVFTEDAVKSFEESNSDRNLTAARIAVEKLQANVAAAFSSNGFGGSGMYELTVTGPRMVVDKESEVRISGYKRRLATALLARGRNAISNDPDRAVADLRLAERFGITSEEISSLKSALGPVLSARIRDSLGSDQIETAMVEYTSLLWADPQAVSSVETQLFSKLSPEMLTHDFLEMLSNRPPEVVLRLPSIKNSIGMTLRLVPKSSFYLGVYEVTQEQYQKVIGTNPSALQEPQNPVEQVSWEDAVNFCSKLSALPEEKAAGRIYRLPTEVEWEHACRAGSTSVYSFGNDPAQLAEYAWFKENSGGDAHPVGGKKPNAWGFYDFHGNVREWCSDVQENLTPGVIMAPSYVICGGSWGDDVTYCKCASRYNYDPSRRGDYCGFRIALILSGIPKHSGAGQEK
ncbi:MAG: hypothetical protein RLY14_1155 [Planctomycetota bacterium]|jgi:serine/threonine protein kinase